MFIENHFFITQPPGIRKTPLMQNSAATISLVIWLLFGTMLILTRHLHHYQIL